MACKSRNNHDFDIRNYIPIMGTYDFLILCKKCGEPKRIKLEKIIREINK